jgi:hypothetical protein
MNTASSNPPKMRGSVPSPRRSQSALDTLERLAQKVGAVSATHPSRLGSGVYRMDEYAGIERLDRAELDETDEG